MDAREVCAGMVTTIIPVRNRKLLLQEAVASVLCQIYRPVEVIIVDDGSTDGTAAMADELAKTNPGVVAALHLEGDGPGPARNAGMRCAKGEFIQYLDSDDLLMPDKFHLQVAALRGHPECGVAYGKTRYYRLGSPRSDRPWKRTGESIARMFPSFLQSRWWGTSTPLYRRELVDAAGSWTDLSNEEDWEYDCRIAKMGVSLCRVEAFVSDQRDHTGERLSRGGTVDRAKLRDRSQAHELILGHAREAGIGTETEEMRHFARELFLLARQCGAAGLEEESRRLFLLAREASTPENAKKADFIIYGAAARMLGWSVAGKAASLRDRLRLP